VVSVFVDCGDEGVEIFFARDARNAASAFSVACFIAAAVAASS